jgi:two-component system chemotaxis response regulator CheB
VTARKIKVLVVDDSALVRRILSEVISRQPDMEVVGTAPDPFVARDMVVELSPDVLTLDIEMPRMDGLTFLTKLMQHRPTPTIVISSTTQAMCDTAIEALRRGAVEVLAKPGPNSIGDLGEILPQKIRAAFGARLKKNALADPPLVASLPSAASTGQAYARGSLIVIGASTGGTTAIEEILTRLPADCPPVVIVQHIPAAFSASFATRLNSVCKVEVKEAKDQDMLAPGRVLIAPGNFHMLVQSNGGVLRASVQTGPLVQYQRPAVDVLFSSVAQLKLPRMIGVLLTGMGTDGAGGLLKLRTAGAWTIAQDEATCVVFGMPKAAIALGAVCQTLPLPQVAAGILKAAASK